MKGRAARDIATGEWWTCPSCNYALPTPYCPACGEYRLNERDLTLRGLVHQVGVHQPRWPILRSFRSLVTEPGALTLACLQGQRKPYTLPLQLFLVANVCSSRCSR